MNLALLMTYIFAILILLLTPGPVVALVTGTAIRFGYRRAFATVVGTNLASFVLIFFAALMLIGVVSLDIFYLRVLGVIGSCFIGYMAIQSLQTISTVAKNDEKNAGSSKSGMLQGFITGISNPKDILFFVSLFPQFIAITNDFSTSIFTLSIVWMIFDITVLSLYILIVKRWLPNKHNKGMEILSSLFLLVIAVLGVIYNIYEMVGLD
ncbi:LysE family translocator [Marinomonas rhizomae]|jgi:threonine/homoserine/homoserine lactone efflux protein|uniref:Threonine/homoserine/homoserine lactone efflux protein n=1 Tax=Marinomonas rhizomae TaxID=491948 RepID=A0A366JEF9_9GAMM|nr:LysE family translocator [Marinomonas rhizomae]RBP84238.1 threonine/homoserine/homoserine lactone efflux protein [Marinomonas rhizomae]RNF74561.1 LysE family translocator [Marinomonas rhizomae]